MIPERKCSICNNLFLPKSFKAKYCYKCKEISRINNINRYSQKLIEKRKYRLCKLCGINLSISQRFCSECFIIANTIRKNKELEDNKIRSLEYFKKVKDNSEFKRKRNERFKIYWKKRYDNDLNYKISMRLRNLLNKSLKYYTKSGKVYSSSKYGIDYKKIIEHLKPFPQDLSKYHIDHIKPLYSFDLTNSEEVKKAFVPENHQWLLARDNIIKGKRIINQSTLF